MRSMRFFHTEDEKNDYLKWRDIFHACLSRLDKKQRAVAICCFDADLTGIKIPVHQFAWLCGISAAGLFRFISKMKSKCLVLLHAGDI